MKPSQIIACLILAFSTLTATAQDNVDELRQRALQAETELRSQDALQLFLELEKSLPDDAFILQKIARQYSDAIVDLTDVEQQRDYARRALDYAERAVAVAPNDPVSVLSIAVAHGKLAGFSDTRTKIEYSRAIKEETERALRLDPDYAWAHHVLGRWHREVASLGSFSRFFVRVVYGGLPNASYEDAIHHLERAVALEPGVLAHHLELGFAYEAAGRDAEARQQFELGLALPSTEKHDELAKARARDLMAQRG